MAMTAHADVDPEPDRSPGELARLVDAARLGDRGAFAALYGRYSCLIHGVVLTRVARKDVDDLVQDVFLIAMQRLPSLHSVDAFGAWLCAIARNRATDHLRRTPATEEFTERHSPSVTTPDHGDAERALAAIRRLPDAYREPLMLRLVEGLSGPEIAALTGLTPGSVRVNLHRGMKLLRANFEGPTR
jgi:RNA polymerase sigma-70 factor (ECF subfamily)